MFEACHAVIPPQPYYQGCVFDQCYAGNADVVCSSLELYASLCTSHSVCIDWRGRTNHTCRECLCLGWEGSLEEEDLSIHGWGMDAGF